MGMHEEWVGGGGGWGCLLLLSEREEGKKETRVHMSTGRHDKMKTAEKSKVKYPFDQTLAKLGLQPRTSEVVCFILSKRVTSLKIFLNFPSACNKTFAEGFDSERG